MQLKSMFKKKNEEVIGEDENSGLVLEGSESPKKKKSARIALAIAVCFLFGEGGYIYMKTQNQQPPVAQPKIEASSSSAPTITDTADFKLAQKNPFWFDKKGTDQMYADGEMPMEYDEDGNPIKMENRSYAKMNMNNFARPVPPNSMPPDMASNPLPSKPTVSSGSLNLPSHAIGQTSESDAGSSSSASSSDMKVAGILLGNNGKSMAILSDGTILEEGKEYNGQTVFSIAENGVSFDNGNTMPYNK